MKKTSTNLTVFLGALLIRWALLPSPGYYGDLTTWKNWMWIVMDHGIGGAYTVDLPDYRISIKWPPLYLYLFQFVGYVNEKVLGFPRGFDHALLTPLMKLPALAADLAIGTLLYQWLKRKVKEEVALWWAFLYLFNPAQIMDTAHWGMIADPAYTLFVVASLLAFSGDKIALSGALMAMGILTKPQALPYLPLLLYAALRQFGLKGLFQLFLGGLLVFLCVYLPFILSGTWVSALSVYPKAVGLFPFVHLQAHNPWFLSSLGQLVSDVTPLLGWITPRHIGLFFFGLVYLYALFLPSKEWDWRTLFCRASFIGFAFYILPTQIHDHYLFPVIALLAVASVSSSSMRSLYFFISLSAFLTLVVRDPFIRPFLTEFLPGRRAFLLAMALVISASNTLLLLLWIGLLRREKLDPRRGLGWMGMTSGVFGFLFAFLSWVGHPYLLSWGRRFLEKAIPTPRTGLNYLILGISERPFDFYWQHYLSLLRWFPLALFLASLGGLLFGSLLWRHSRRHPLASGRIEEKTLTPFQQKCLKGMTTLLLCISLGGIFVYHVLQWVR